MSSNIFQFPSKLDHALRVTSDTGDPQLLSAFHEFKKLIEENKVEGFVVVGTTKEGDCFGGFGGVFSPLQLVGMLEHVKVQIIAG